MTGNSPCALAFFERDNVACDIVYDLDVFLIFATTNIRKKAEISKKNVTKNVTLLKFFEILAKRHETANYL